MPSRVKVRSAVVNVVGSIALENVTSTDWTGSVRGVVGGEICETIGTSLDHEGARQRLAAVGPEDDVQRAEADGGDLERHVLGSRVGGQQGERQ